jgi:hypothetical protein
MIRTFRKVFLIALSCARSKLPGGISKVWRSGRVEITSLECKRPPKTETVEDQEFDCAPHDDIAEIVRPFLAQYGVAIVEEPVEFYRDGTLIRIQYQYDVLNTDRPNDKITRHSWSDGADFPAKTSTKPPPLPRKFSCAASYIHRPAVTRRGLSAGAK